MSGRRRTSRNQPRGGRSPGGAEFWGRSPSEEAPTPAKIKPTIDPSALVRSLGDPPLAANPAAMEHHLAVIYEEAVRAATALAAANGLLYLEDSGPSGGAL